MAKEHLTITIDPDSELGRALEETGDEPFVLLRGTTRFRLNMNRAGERYLPQLRRDISAR
jgi:hypothetical protein